MTYSAFEDRDIKYISDALDIAEDKTGNYYKFSFGQWKRYHYDVKTLISLSKNEISDCAFAMLNKGSRTIKGYEPITEKRDFYFICLQDHRILEALARDKDLSLPSLLVYVFTHELVHIVRFCNFFQRFEIKGKGKEDEERLVYNITHEILKDSTLPRMGYILESYKNHRLFELNA
ncbi:MAG: hypothetical protein JW944_12670 [Deltaproteobacteria bacterium]|nr:hypothetical protein [Deltaproteobacteria bacterium]